MLLLLLAACTPNVEPITGLPNQPGGDPLVPEVALFPFPSDFWWDGEVVLDPEAMPGDLDVATFAGLDGFSLVPPILAYLPGSVDPADLPGPEASVAPDSRVLLLREDTWEPVPVLAEVDLHATDPGEQALILRPVRALEPSTGYVVLLRGLHDAAGEPHTAGDAFRALRDGIPTDSSALESWREDFTLVQDAIEALGIAPEEVLLGWSFHTRSRAGVQDPTLALHAAMAAAPLDWTLVSDAVDGDNRLVEGTFEVPEFLGPDGRLVLDEGVPVPQGTAEVPFLLTLPVTVTEPRPVVLFGHGFFSSREEPTWSSLNDSLQRWRMSAVTIDFEGFDDASAIDTAAAIGGDLGALAGVIDQQVQSQARFTALARLVSEHLAQDVVDGEVPLLDGERVVYLGISNGGSQGFPIVAASDEISRAALVVPGGAWSHMLQRAVQWNTMGFLLESRYDDPRDVQLVVSLIQHLFDPVDAMSWTDRIEGEEITLHEAVGDAQVNNLVTHMVARSAGIPLITPAPLDVWGLETVGADPGVSQALFVYDEGYPPLPDGNLPPGTDNGAHETVRLLEAYKEQVGAFLETGEIRQVCQGPCDPD